MRERVRESAMVVTQNEQGRRGEEKEKRRNKQVSKDKDWKILHYYVKRK